MFVFCGPAPRRGGPFIQMHEKSLLFEIHILQNLREESRSLEKTHNVRREGPGMDAP